MKTHLRTTFLFSLLVSLTATLDAQASPAVLFSEDFESYPVNSTLVGQGGWTRFVTPLADDPVLIANGVGLPSQVVNGHVDPGTGDRGSADHPFLGVVNDLGVTRLTADAFAFSSGPPTHNYEISLTDGTSNTRIGWTVDLSCGSWEFFSSPSAINVCFVGAVDEPVVLEIIVDGAADENYGRLIHSAGVFETPRFHLSHAEIAALNSVHIFVDFRNPGAFLAGEFDNILVTTTDPDGDQDGIPDDEDSCPNSDFSPTVMIAGCDSGVANVLVQDGCTIADLIGTCAVEAPNHGTFVSCVAKLTNSLKNEGVITGAQKGAIQRCAAQAAVP